MTFRLAAALLAATLATLPAAAQSPGGAPGAGEWRHGLSLLGDVKYPADFKHFDYVNPDAPKGGTVRLGALGTFDSLNAFVPKGNEAAGLNLLYDTLMTDALDEPATEYGLIAESVRYPADYSSVTYRLRPEARFNDGSPVTAEDVVWSFETLKRIDPMRSRYYHDVAKAEITGEREVTFTFAGPGNRELPQITGQIPILPKKFWEGSDEQGRKRNIEEGTLDKPLGSGPYRVKAFAPGRWISYERSPDYWAAKLPARVGIYNFDEMRFDYYRDSTVLVEAFKGDQFDYREENSAKNWATAYAFPAVQQKKVLLEKFVDSQSGRMQGYAFNIRRDKFKDPRVRRAFNLAFDFEEINKSIMFGQYVRIDSYFYGTDLASKGLPEGREKEILESVRDKIPAEVFTSAYKNPVGGSPEKARENLREAVRLLKEAGWTVSREGGKAALKNEKGEAFKVEFIYGDPTGERLLSFYKPALERLGVEVTMRLLDDSQYINRIRSFDFDMVTVGWGQSLSPGNEQRDMWGSSSADVSGSQNFVGIKDPGVDALIDKIIFAKDRDDLTAAARALDRVLLAHNYVVPQFTSIEDRTARWDRFSRPAKLPPRGAMFPTVWWWDAEKAKAVGGRS
ncbi:extracellular solute-binding protein [Chenggangzhangella methanolivorans]|uniref:Extracellular solute-binding protein n=1 Tax=Chenggangzhangella methanolivorans TaxID=1437009 RepID=A0A9E6UR63_9HYPH|nr:extracellular solute-binding protein [Chenggangzhangella methanolivorans]QZO01910.1 extracellular solute-binding protein [Chenggangzhangella methanolivorans]